MPLKPAGCLWPLSIPYQAAVRVRNRLYDLQILNAHDCGAPVVSVGNITSGGAGKTPFVMFLADRCRELSGGGKLKCAIVSRGYRGSAKGTLLVGDGKRTLADFALAGDEPAMMAGRRLGASVVVDRNRVRGARFAVSDLKSQLILLDDGFQHRRLKRNLDIVLLDAQDPLGNRMVLPAGVLREPVSSLKRADIIVLSKATAEIDEMQRRAEELSRLLSKPVMAASLEASSWHRVNGKEIAGLAACQGKRVAAFAGIAHPESFFQTVKSLGAELAAWTPLPDHCRYTKAQLDHLARVFVRSRAEWLVTTEKDALKLPLEFHLLPTWSLRVDVKLTVGEEVLDKALQDILAEAEKSVP